MKKKEIVKVEKEVDVWYCDKCKKRITEDPKDMYAGSMECKGMEVFMEQGAYDLCMDCVNILEDQRKEFFKSITKGS